MGEAAGVEGWRRSGVSVGNCRGSDRGIDIYIYIYIINIKSKNK